MRVEGGGGDQVEGGRERLLAVDDSAGVPVCDCRLGHTSTGQSIKYPDTWRQG